MQGGHDLLLVGGRNRSPHGLTQVPSQVMPQYSISVAKAARPMMLSSCADCKMMYADWSSGPIGY